MAEPWIHRELKRLLTERDRLAGAVREDRETFAGILLNVNVAGQTEDAGGETDWQRVADECYAAAMRGHVRARAALHEIGESDG